MDHSSQQTLQRWWQSMVLPAHELKKLHIQPAPSSHRAQLKRCESADAAMLTEGFRALWLSLDDATRERPHAIECWASIAAILVHIKQDDTCKLAIAAGRKGDGDKSVVSELRFAQLQQAKTPEDFVRRMRRMVQQVGGTLSVVELGRDIERWFSEHSQFRPRQADKRISVQWAMDYYRAASGKAK